MPKLKTYEDDKTTYGQNDLQLLTAKQLAAKLNLSYSALAMMRLTGGGPKFLKLAKGKGGTILYDWKDILVYLESCKRISTSDNGDKR
jgi:hypothetical protein